MKKLKILVMAFCLCAAFSAPVSTFVANAATEQENFEVITTRATTYEVIVDTWVYSDDTGSTKLLTLPAGKIVELVSQNGSSRYAKIKYRANPNDLFTTEAYINKDNIRLV